MGDLEIVHRCRLAAQVDIEAILGQVLYSMYGGRARSAFFDSWNYNEHIHPTDPPALSKKFNIPWHLKL